jgi:cytochrome c oxidase subunit IV
MATAAHPTPRTYWIVGGFLAVATAIEIAISYMEFLGPARGPLLVAFGITKWVTVVAIYMHLRYDLRSYRVLFLFGLVGAFSVFVVVLAAMHAL